MKFRRYILIVGALLALFSSLARAQDYVAVVCTGDTGVSFMVEGWEHSTFEWSVEGGTISRNYGDSIIVNWTSTPGEYEISVLEISEHGCAGELKRATVLVAGPELELGDNRSICSGEIFTMEPEGSYDSYLWHDGSTGTEWSSGEEGWIILEVADTHGCRARDSIYLTVNPLPVVDLGRDTSLCGDQSIELNAGNDGCLLYTSPSPRDRTRSRMPSSA